jgi:hypothetical protein
MRVVQNRGMARANGGIVSFLMLVILAAGVAALRLAGGPGESDHNGVGSVRTEVATAVRAVVCGRPMRQSDLLIAGDFDGDGRSDKAYEFQRGDAPWVLGVCLADARSDEVEIGTSEGSFRADDLDGDGRDEIIYGGTTAWQQIDEVAVILNGIVRLVDGPGLASGALDSDDSGQAWGCEDVDGDDRREVVQVTVRHEGKLARWARETYRLEGTLMPLLSRKTGETNAESVPWQQAASLVGRC